jgi:hypothetical protein
MPTSPSKKGCLGSDCDMGLGDAFIINDVQEDTETVPYRSQSELNLRSEFFHAFHDRYFDEKFVDSLPDNSVYVTTGTYTNICGNTANDDDVRLAQQLL